MLTSSAFCTSKKSKTIKLREGNVFTRVCQSVSVSFHRRQPCDHYLNLFKLIHIPPEAPGPKSTPPPYRDPLDMFKLVLLALTTQTPPPRDRPESGRLAFD